MKITANYKKSFIITSMCYIIVGVIVLLFPQLDEIKICYALGAITVLLGVIYVVRYFTRTDFTDVYRLDFVYGIVLMAGGIYAIACPSVVGKWLYIVVGAVICIDSLIKLQNAIDLMRMKSSLWWAVLVMALVTGAMSIMLLSSKSHSVFTPTQFIGISLIVDGTINIASLLTLAFSLNRARKAVPEEMPSQLKKQEQSAAVQVKEPQLEELKPEEKPTGKRMAFFDMLTNDGADEQDDDD